MASLADKSVVVTGASSGIGRAIAIACAQSGADVLLHYHVNAQGAEDTSTGVRRAGRTAILAQGDLAVADRQDELVDCAWNWHEIDVWINNAGADVLTGETAAWSFDEKLGRLWQIDVLATMRLSRAVGKRMVNRGRGVILNMGWDQAAYGMEGDSGEMFAAAKGAIMAFTKSLAKSLAPQVRVNCLAPGWIRTAWGEQASADWDQRARGESMLARWGTPEDVARAACFLASDEASFITGQIVNVNGGYRGG